MVDPTFNTNNITCNSPTSYQNKYCGVGVVDPIPSDKTLYVVASSVHWLLAYPSYPKNQNTTGPVYLADGVNTLSAATGKYVRVGCMTWSDSSETATGTISAIYVA